MTMAPADAAEAASEGARFDAWCNCVRQLLGGSDGAAEDWRALFAAGRSPRDAARAMVYGDADVD
jgi:hypothetical protein